MAPGCSGVPCTPAVQFQFSLKTVIARDLSSGMRPTPNAAIILTVDAQVVKRLLALNREFYAEFAGEFSGTRSSGRVNLEPITPYLRNGLKVLDAGCGNGRLAERLDREGYGLTYVGIDATPELIEIAKKGTTTLRGVSAEFHVTDITAPGWTAPLQTHAPFDAAFALALLHHIPGFELRCRVLSEIRAMLRPEGVLLMSNWQFMQNERLRHKIVPWQKIGIGEKELEEGDALLDWKRGGTGYRYVHQFTTAEVQSLSDQSGFQMLEQFQLDADLNLFSILKRAG
jgi:tRNA (uracil-5-)-methyltransferase TRM9